MPPIFTEGEIEQTVGATCGAGLMLTADGSSEIRSLINLCAFIWQDDSAPLYVDDRRQDYRHMRRLYGELLGGGYNITKVDTDHQKVIARILEKRSRNRFEDLILSLVLVLAEWDFYEEEVKQENNKKDSERTGLLRLRFFLSLADPTRKENKVSIQFQRDTAAFVIRPGSIDPSFALEAALNASGWLIAVAGKGASVFRETAGPSGDWLVESIRRSAKEKCPNFYPLVDLNVRGDAAEIEALRQHDVVIVFLHGLFATDIGTFDGFITQLNRTNPFKLASRLDGHLQRGIEPTTRSNTETLRTLITMLQSKSSAFSVARPDLAKWLPNAEWEHIQRAVDQSIGLAGFPHNTLTSIGTNAEELADALNRAFPDPPKIVFVCHSRGGLVAREAIVNLLNNPESREVWRNAMHALVTFGTPHNGAAIAEHSLRSVATYFLLLQSTQRLVSISKLLSYLGERTAEGIEHLKRFDASTDPREQSFVARLYAKEGTLKRRKERRVPFTIAVGGKLGDVARETWAKRTAACMVSRWIAAKEHDLVVETVSATSIRLDAEVNVVSESDHFDYFHQLAANPQVASDIAIARIWTAVNWETAFSSASIKVQKPYDLKRYRLDGSEPKQ